VRRQDFSFDLPEELIAQSPLPERSASRLLVLDGATGAITDRTMGDLPSYLRAGDLLVFNDTRVVAARIVGAKPSGGRVEIFLERVAAIVPVPPPQGPATAHEAAGHATAPPYSGAPAHAVAQPDLGASSHAAPQPSPGTTANVERQALVQLRASKPIREGLEITTPGGVVRVVGREDELWRVEVPGPGDALEFFEAWGEVPLPPYIHRSANATDRERYQSIFAREKGAVAAPTASLHFDAPLVAKLEGMGVGRAFVTLHVGAGTFQPLRTDDLDAHKMHAERVSVSTATWDAIRRTREAGGRVIAVGTTVVRALESAALKVPGFIASRASATEPSGPNESMRNVTREFAADEMPESAAADLTREFAADGMSESAADLTRESAADSTRDAGEAGHAALAAPRNAWSGETRLFIRPGFEFQLVDAMVTNFHLPESTLLMLVSAFAGREQVLAAYAHAVREQYRFFSYGDAMLVMPTQIRPAQAGRTQARS
jgi:S-adenosylmethionine:tRNA ribosyltransferase-isomerase